LFPGARDFAGLHRICIEGRLLRHASPARISTDR
jgi:hypothetical protein